MSPLRHVDMKPKYLLAVGVLLLVAAIACTTGDERSVEPTTEDNGESASPLGEFLPNEIPLAKGPVSSDGVQAIFATPDLGIGENRIGFVLISPDDFIRTPETTVTSFFFPGEGSEGEPEQTVQAVFRPWPYGARGLYTTSLTFDTPGRWGIEIDVPNPDRDNSPVELFFDVEETPITVANGSPAIASRSKTLNDVEEISELTTGSIHDPDLYGITIADAVKSGLPTVVVMASPAFCTNAVCGPQVEVLQDLKNKYKGQSHFIHVDIYDNPAETQGNLDAARLSPVVMEWGLPSTEWTFVIDREGIVSSRFEAFATLEELDQALQRVL